MAHEIRAAVRLKKNLPVLDLAEMAQAGASVVVPSHGEGNGKEGRLLSRHQLRDFGGVSSSPVWNGEL